MTPEQLKASIISFALQGKLLEQTGDGTVKEFVTKYKIKEKNYSEEVGFDIPENWAWVSFDDVCDILGGFAFKSTDYQLDGIRVIRISDFNENGLIDKDIKYYKEDSSLEKYLIKKNDILMCMTGGTVGKTCFLQNNEEPLYLNQRVANIRSKYPSFIDTKYLYLVVCSFYIKNIVNASKTSTNDNISMGTIQNFPLPLPPLEEQHRIITKIEELIPYVDRYAESYEKLGQFNAKFPEDMKKSILQYAIQGKLVEQRPEEGTAEELYQQIQEEKQKLIKEGEIKKDKSLPEITSDEIPFDIPVSWEWIRLGTIISLQSGQDLKPSEYNSLMKGIPYLTGASNIENNGNIVINRWTDTPKAYATKGDLLLTCKGTVGKLAFLDEEKVHIARQIMAIKSYSMDSKFIRYYLETQISDLKGMAKSMIPGIERENVLKLVFPLPPLEEQHRIVAKIEELLPYCDKLANKE